MWFVIETRITGKRALCMDENGRDTFLHRNIADIVCDRRRRRSKTSKFGVLEFASKTEAQQWVADVESLAKLGSDCGLDFAAARLVREQKLRQLLVAYKEQQGTENARALEDQIVAFALEGFPDGS